MENRQIIVREIIKWRQSKLLPEQYCDFLLNLYRDEDEPLPAIESVHGAIDRPRVLRIVGWIIGTFIFTIYVLVSFYFSDLSLPMQLGLSSFLIVVLYAAGFFMRNRRQTMSYLAFGAGSILLLFVGPYLLQSVAAGPAAIIAYVLGCSVLWVALGLSFRIGLLQFCGWAGLMLVYGWAIADRFERVPLWQAQLHWLPLSFLFAWSGWLVQVRWKHVTRVMLLLSAIVIFVPELHHLLSEGFGGGGAAAWIATGKAVLLAAVLASTRKHWMEWIK